MTGDGLFGKKKYCWLIVCGWFVLREKYSYKPNEQDAFCVTVVY
jgi:hypothetical protein